MEKPFLTAQWKNLILITYAVDPQLLTPHLPAGLELDTINGKAFLSLVAFEFNDTKVKGLKFPYHVNFPEINLRFYVRDKERRGVVFIKELVPRFIIANIANILYNENYESVHMNYQYVKCNQIKLKHEITYKKSQYYIEVNAELSSAMPDETSIEHFFKEHEWGFGSTRKGKTLIYRVEHPFWNVHKIIDVNYNFDFGKVYGEKWKVLNNMKPYNVTFADGSAIKVFPPQSLT